MNVYEVGLKYKPSLSQTEVNCVKYRNSLHISCFQNVLIVIVRARRNINVTDRYHCLVMSSYRVTAL